MATVILFAGVVGALGAGVGKEPLVYVANAFRWTAARADIFLLALRPFLYILREGKGLGAGLWAWTGFA
jgi:hypothetical protein